MRFYVASGLPNRERAADAVRFLTSLGHTPSYDWTAHGDVRSEGEARMGQVSTNELAAVCDAELVVVLLPGGPGTHTELGAALATREDKRIFLWSQEESALGGGPQTCVFYHHPAVTRICCPYEELLQQLAAL
ncbi:MAG: hypothetical protein LBN26_00435 [Christensenellaceae bacterium]|jgi:hypothetical protein|nr:hypothetical protein [Christensenellaceae bacterium]